MGKFLVWHLGLVSVFYIPFCCLEVWLCFVRGAFRRGNKEKKKKERISPNWYQGEKLIEDQDMK